MTEEKSSSAKATADKTEEIKAVTIIEDGVVDAPIEVKADPEAGKPEELPEEVKKKLEKQKATRTPMKGKRKKKVKRSALVLVRLLLDQLIIIRLLL
jgi:hypothetical protein